MTTDRDEVERLALDCEAAARALKSDDAFLTGQSIFTEAAALLRALREKLEAAEAELVALTQAHDTVCGALATATAALTTARAEGAANWLAGRDAAAERVSLLGRVVSMDSPTGRATERCLSVVRSTPLPADFAAALAEHDQRVWNAALEEAAGVASSHRPSLSLTAGSGPNGYWRGVEENTSSIAAAIRALKKGDKP